MFKKLLGLDALERRLAALENEKSELEQKNQELQKAIEEKAKTPKEIANEKGEPWVSVVDTGFQDPNNPRTGYFELDWNKEFINKLTEAGYSGRTDEDVIDMWFNDLCRGVTQDLPE